MFQISHASMSFCCVHCSLAAPLSGHVFPQTGLARAGNGQHLDVRSQQIAKAADVLRVAGPHQDRCGAQVERIGFLHVERARQGLRVVGEHVLGTAEDDVCVLLCLVEPLRGGPGCHVHGDLVHGAERLGGLLHCRGRAAGAVDVDDALSPDRRGGKPQRARDQRNELEGLGHRFSSRVSGDR